MTETQLVDLRRALDALASAIERCADRIGGDTSAIRADLDEYREFLGFVLEAA